MFKHIVTTEPIFLNNKNLDIKKEPVITKLLIDWSNKYDFNTDEYNIRLFYLSNILTWNKQDDKFYYDNLRYLIEQGRKTKQLVILHIDNIKQLDELKETALYESINHLCDYLKIA